MNNILDTTINTLTSKEGRFAASLTLSELFDKIKNGNGSSEKIRLCREAYLSQGKNALYPIKDTLPMYCVSAVFNNKGRKIPDIISTTNLLYIDLDFKDHPDVYSELFLFLKQNKHVLAAYRSASGFGISAIILSHGITTSNYTATVHSFINTELTPYIHLRDAHPVNINRFIYITDDRDLYLNPTCEPFNPCENKAVKKSGKHPNKEYKDIVLYYMSYDGYRFLKFERTLDEYNSDCVFIKEGLDYYCVYYPFVSSGVPKKIRVGIRNSIISQIANNIICLNPDANRNDIVNFVLYSNNRICSPPLPVDEVVRMVDYKIKQQELGELFPMGVTKKYYWVKPDVDNRKQTYLNALKNISKDRIMEMLDRLDTHPRKITIQYIADFLGICEKTVRSRLSPEQKQLIKQHNQKLKNNGK